MALDVGIGDGSSPVPVQGEPSLSLESDGYYCFLHPLFERLRAETGQYIDLYGEASFTDEALTALERLLLDARALVAAQPETWEVFTGTQFSNVDGRWQKLRDKYDAVCRDRFLELITQWQQITARARELGRPVVCFGD